MNGAIVYTRRTTPWGWHVKHITWGFLTGGLWLITGYPLCWLARRQSILESRQIR